MNTLYLLDKIKSEFKNVSLNNDYTLPEEDYFDTSYWYFDKIRIDLNLTEEEWANQEIHFIDTGGWLPEDRQEAINAIKEKRRMSNRYSDPFEIPSVYLDRCATGFSFLAPQAYLFYTPAIMNCILSDPEFNQNLIDPHILYSNGFSSWLARLRNANNYELISNLLTHFGKIQVDLVLCFLKHISIIETPDDQIIKRLDATVLSDINECINNIKFLYK